MNTLLKIALLVSFVIVGAEDVFADRDEFCQGFEEGYKSIMGDLVVVPVCPVEPVTPVGSTSFREGIKAGIKAAETKKRRGY